MIATCGNCRNKAPINEWLELSYGKLPPGVMQCPKCLVRVRRRPIGGRVINGHFIPDHIKLETEIPPYDTMKTIYPVKDPFRNQRKKRR